VDRCTGRHLRRERPDHTLQSAALVHEAYLRLFAQTPFDTENRAHFVMVASRLMRQILVDHARTHGAADLRRRHRGGVAHVALDAMEAEERFEREPSGGLTPEQLFEKGAAMALLAGLLEARSTGRGRASTTFTAISSDRQSIGKLCAPAMAPNAS